MNKEITIDGKIIGGDSPTYIIAEMSANHLMSFERAKEIIYRLKDSGTDAVKLQTYTADTITIDSDRPEFQIHGGLWDGYNLYSLYQEAYTPWEWQKELMEYANSLGLTCFSSPFDFTAVDFMEEIGMPAYKVASYEIFDIPMIRKIAKIGKPIIFSTGIAHRDDVERALSVCKEEGNENVVLLKCTSAYPCPYEAMNIKTIPLMQETYDCIVGLSDHTFGSEVALGAVALGAKVVEKHVTIKRADGGPDGGFSMEMEEFIDMVRQIRNLEKALGKGTFELTDKQEKERAGGRSLYVVADIKAGELFTPDNIRSIRPGRGLHPMYYDEVIGKKATCDIKKGEPLDRDMIE
ncbi:MAG: pseudaminic acid synthase [Lachnospiraceae bacterium]|jgi:pseudaminic acid synthase|nr:pseudaminic acid synthase [Lachnospiraceae bacterium]